MISDAPTLTSSPQRATILLPPEPTQSVQYAPLPNVQQPQLRKRGSSKSLLAIQLTEFQLQSLPLIELGQCNHRGVGDLLGAV